MQHKTANKLLTSLAESGRTGRTINHILCQHSPASLMQLNTDEWYRCLVSAIQNEYEYFNEVSAPIPILVSVSVHPYFLSLFSPPPLFSPPLLSLFSLSFPSSLLHLFTLSSSLFLSLICLSLSLFIVYLPLSLSL